MGRSVAIIGSGNWGSTIGKIVGFNVQNSNFEKEVSYFLNFYIIF